MKETLKKSAIVFLSAALGGLMVIAVMIYSPSLRSKISREVIRVPPHEQADENFLIQTDPFEELQKMRQQFEKRSMTDSWFSNKLDSNNDISEREDDNFIYYDIKVDDVNATSINTNIENGYITISGTTEKKSESKDKDNSAQSIFKSTFHRTFPLPENVEPNKMQMLTAKDKIILKFPKIKT